MPLTVGSRLGSYEIVALLGAGGMGAVYQARDTKLGRAVAIKVILDAFASDSERIGRFEREAKMLASLNHPRIAALFGMEHVDGQHLLVMELIEGETLADRLRRGPMPIDTALSTAIQIAEALEAAHEKGVVHRDLKPANVKITAEGEIKVLDFGLAKVMESESTSAGLANSPTLSMMASQAGLILGTAAYMSPEQAKGLPADHRSDVFSFGTVFFEMLTGRQPFSGDTAPDVMASVLVREPDLELLPPKLNPRVSALVRRCLEKSPRRRWQAIGDVRAELEIIAGDPHPVVSGEGPATDTPVWRRAMPILVTAVLASGLTALAAWTLMRPVPPPVARFTFPLPDGQRFSASGRPLLDISPDGTQLVYVADQQLHLRPLSSLEARPIKGAGGAGGVLNPRFSPDGRSIVFWSGAEQALKRIPVEGGTPSTICAASRPYGISWHGPLIFVGQGSAGIIKVPADGGTPETVVTLKPDEQAYGPELLPDGDTLLFTIATSTAIDKWDRSKVVRQSLKSGERRVLIDDASDARYVPTGHLLYARSGVLMATRFDTDRLSPTGSPVTMVQGIRRSDGGQTGAAQFSISANGTVVYVPGPVSGSSPRGELAFIDRSGKEEKLKLPSFIYESPRASPDGKHLAVTTGDATTANVWIYDLSGTRAIRQLTFGGLNRYPVWTPDSQRIAFQSDREGDLGIFWQRADGTDTARRLTKPQPGASHIPEAWSRVRDRLFFTSSAAAVFSLWSLSLPEQKLEAMDKIASRGSSLNSSLTKDGRWIAYSVGEGKGVIAIYVAPLPWTGPKYRIANGVFPVWSSDARELYYMGFGGTLFATKVSTERGFEFSEPVRLPVSRLFFAGPAIQRGYDVMPDGRLIAAIPPQEGQGALPEQIEVVINWFEDLKRQAVPAK